MPMDLVQQQRVHFQCRRWYHATPVIRLAATYSARHHA